MRPVFQTSPHISSSLSMASMASVASVVTNPPSLFLNPHTLTESTKTNRCAHESCKKKLTLTDFACRCEARFCAAHRFPQDHACAYDYKAAATTTLGKQLVKCAGERMVDKI